MESGSERIRKEILRRPVYSNEEIAEFCSKAKEAGININLYVLLGIPGEKKTDFDETVNCVRQCNPRDVFLSIYYPYPGTDLYNMAVEQGYLKPGQIKETNMERSKSVLNMPFFSQRQIQGQFILFPYRIYKGVLPLPHIVARMLRGIASANSMLNSVFRKLINSNFLLILKRRFAPFVDK